jgi:hypothetical protein
VDHSRDAGRDLGPPEAKREAAGEDLALHVARGEVAGEAAVGAVVPAELLEVVGRPGGHDEGQVVDDRVANVPGGDRDDLVGRRHGDEIRGLAGEPAAGLFREVQEGRRRDFDGVGARRREREHGEKDAGAQRDDSHSNPPRFPAGTSHRDTGAFLRWIRPNAGTMRCH